MYNILTLNKISETGLCRFNEQYTCATEMTNPDAILVRSASMHDMEFQSNTLAIARAGAGVNNIPIDKCSEQGIVVFNTPGANANAVKELVLTGLFLSSRKIIPAIDWALTLKGNGDTVPKDVEKGKGAFAGPEIKGKALGVIGLGAIGVMVANAANHLGMKVYGYDPYLSVKSAWNLNHNAVYINDINEIFAKCDYITIHVPLTDSTKGLINKDTIAKCKDGVRILNFSRAALVNDADLKAALESGKVASYVTDFPTEEVLDIDGVIAIPHLGASTPESEDNCASMAAKELIDYIENGNIVNSVNLPEVTMPRSGENRICVIHKNIPNMITAIAGIFADDGVNIENMLNKSRGDYAYTMLDTGAADTDTVAKEIEAIDGVIKVRVI